MQPTGGIRVLHRPLCAALVALTLALVGPTPARPADPFQIDVILPMTGAAAFIGASERTAFVIAQNVINAQGGIRGRDVAFVFRDDASSPQVSVQLANAIIDRHVPAFFSSLVPNCAAIQPLVAKGGPVDYCLAGIIHPVPNGFVFAAGPSSVDYAVAIVRYLRERGITRVAIMTSTDATGIDMDGGLDAAFSLPANRGVQIVDREHFNVTDLDLGAQMARIRAANPQFLITYTVGTPFGTVLRSFRDAGLDIPLLAANGDMLLAQQAQFKSILPKEMLFAAYRASAAGGTRPGPILDAQKVFYKALKEAGVQADIAPITSWDPIFVIINALRALGTDATPQQLHDYIVNLHGFAGINAIYDFRGGSQRGITSSAVVVDRWDPANTDWVAVSAPGGALLKR